MRWLLAFLLALPLIGDDAKPLATVELSPEINARIKVEVDKQVIPLRDQIAYLQRKLQMYQQGLFACQDAQIDAQAKAKPEKK